MGLAGRLTGAGRSQGRRIDPSTAVEERLGFDLSVFFPAASGSIMADAKCQPAGLLCLGRSCGDVGSGSPTPRLPPRIPIA